MQLLRAEEARSFADYGFLVIAGDASANFVQRSALSAFPVATDLPGLIGHFQVDARGRLGTPLLPGEGIDAARYGIPAAEREQRAARVARIREILGENRLVTARGDRTSEAASVIGSGAWGSSPQGSRPSHGPRIKAPASRSQSGR